MTPSWVLPVFTLGLLAGLACCGQYIADGRARWRLAEQERDFLSDALDVAETERDQLAAEVVSLREGVRHNVVQMPRQRRVR